MGSGSGMRLAVPTRMTISLVARDAVDAPVAHRSFLCADVDAFSPMAERFGGHILLGVDFGLYLNAGQLYDFLAGLVGYDPAEDDGLSKLQADWPGDL